MKEFHLTVRMASEQMYILSISTRTAPTLDSRVQRLHPDPRPNLCIFAEDGVGSCRRVTWWGALCPRLPRIGSELASARVDIRLAAAGDWPFDWGGAFEGRGDVRQHFPSGARARAHPAP